jgi:hypothetical protein
MASKPATIKARFKNREKEENYLLLLDNAIKPNAMASKVVYNYLCKLLSHDTILE